VYHHKYSNNCAVIRCPNIKTFDNLPTISAFSAKIREVFNKEKYNNEWLVCVLLYIILYKMHILAFLIAKKTESF